MHTKLFLELAKDIACACACAHACVWVWEAVAFMQLVSSLNNPYFIYSFKTPQTTELYYPHLIFNKTLTLFVWHFNIPILNRLHNDTTEGGWKSSEKKKSVSNIQTHTRKKLIRLSHLGELAIKSCWLFLQAYKEM